MGVPAIVTAGDRRAAKAVYGESKVYLQVEGVPLVARVVQVLQHVPEVTEVWVIGSTERLESVLGAAGVQASLTKPLRIIEQRRNLFENCWEGYRRVLAGTGPEGRDPVSEEDLDRRVLYLSGDLPFATSQEISDFIQRGQSGDCDYAIGLARRESLANFLPVEPGGPGIEVAYFNMREGRLRQSNLHLAAPGRMGARELIEEMYEHRHQRSFWNMCALGLRILMNQGGGFRIGWGYALIHLGGLADRWGFSRLADWLRTRNTLARAEEGVSRLLQTRCCFVITELGGCAIDVDTEQEYDAVQERFDEWTAALSSRAKGLDS